MKKVLMIVQNDFVNDSRIIKEANALGKVGYNVKVLALHNDGLMEEEEFEAFSVKRIKLETRNKLGKNKLSQGFKYLEFTNKCVKEAKVFSPDILHCHDVYTLKIGDKIIKTLSKKDVKFIYDSHELWSEASNNLTMSYPLLKIQNNIEEKIIKKCNAVITVSPSIVNHLKKIYDLKNDIVLIRNIPYQFKSKINEKIFHKEFKLSADKKVVIYQGVISKGRGIEKIIEAMQYVNNNIVFVILGNGGMVEAYKARVNELNLKDKVYFHSAVDPNILSKYTSSADLGVSMIKNICLSYYYCLPNKMFEYIQSEIPVICSDYPDMKNIVETYGVGEAVDVDEVEEISKAINKILYDDKINNMYIENCKRAKSVLNWEEESKKLIDIYDKILKN